MNLFWLSLNPELCAKYHCDKHYKLILEACQMMYTAWHITGYQDWQKDLPDNLTPYKATHKNHPMCIWVRLTKENYRHTAIYAISLCAEYTKRTGKVHACEKHVNWLSDNYPECDISEENNYKETTIFAHENIPEGSTPVPLCMPDEFKSADLIESYRAYYHSKDFAQWKHCEKPEWFKN